MEDRGCVSVMGRVLRRAGSALVVALGLVSPVLAACAAPSASADTVVDGCSIVTSPSSTTFTSCPDADFAGTNLSGGDLSYADLSGAEFVSCPSGHCLEASLRGANLTRANLSGSLLSLCTTSSGASACGSTDFSDATLSGADLAQSTAQDVTFTNAELSEVNLTDADLGGANLTDADLTGANLTGTLFSSTLPPEFNGGPPVTANAIVTNANFTGTILVPSDQNVTATSQASAVGTWTTPAGLPGAALGSCSPVSGSTFPLGPTTVTCQVVGAEGDAPGAAGIGTFVVTVAPNPGDGTPEAPVVLLLPLAALALLGGMAVRRLR